MLILAIMGIIISVSLIDIVRTEIVVDIVFAMIGIAIIVLSVGFWSLMSCNLVIFVGFEYSVFVEFIENGEIIREETHFHPSRNFLE